MKFRKRPVVIDAMQFYRDAGHSLAEWCGGREVFHEKPSDPNDVQYVIEIPTLEGTLTAQLGDWIIRGVKGEFYPVKPDIFQATYEAVDDAAR